MNKLIILTPVFDDWDCLNKLLASIKQNVIGSEIELLDIIIVNDNSTKPPIIEKIDLPINVINLNTNVGHQRSIAIGLAYISKNYSLADAILIMDSDGEDDPAYIKNLFFEALSKKRIIFAHREKRSESLSFKFFYWVYKRIFYSLTNQKISFGNFCCLPSSVFNKVINNPDLWNHFSGAIIKSKIPYSTIPTKRSKRYFGRSKMNFYNLIIHGFSSISIYIDIVIAKFFIFSLIGIGLIFILTILLVIIKLFTTLAIPGWTSSIALGLINVGGLFFILTLLLFLIQLNQRNLQVASVSQFYSNYIESINSLKSE